MFCVKVFKDFDVKLKVYCLVVLKFKICFYLFLYIFLSMFFFWWLKKIDEGVCLKKKRIKCEKKNFMVVEEFY